MKYFRFAIAALIAAVLVAQGDPTVGSLAAAMTIFGGPFLPNFSPPDDAGATPTAEPPANGVVAFSETQFKKLLDELKIGRSAAVKEVLEEEKVAAPEKRSGVELTDPNSVKVTKQRNVDGDGWKLQLYRLMWGIQANDSTLQAASRGLLAKAGHYGEENRALMQSGTTGAPWLPTQALARIDTLAAEVGIARQLVNVWTGLKPGGTYKIPNITGRPAIRAVNQASNILTRNFTTGSVSLSPKKFGLILGFTPEMEDVIAVQAVDKMIEQLGESLGEMEDMTVFTADGTATYHSMTGILANASVPWVTLAATDVDFSDVSYDKVADMRKTVHVGSRKRGAYVFHHDIEDYILDFVDGSGKYIFDQGSDVEKIRGRRVLYTEAMPSDADSAVSTGFGVYGDYSYVHMGLTDRGPEVKRLDQATILDPADDSTLIHLALTDQEALRFIWEWDVVAQFPANVYTRIRTAAS